MREYFIYGQTYAIREDLKAFGCQWVPEKKFWRTIPLEKGEITYKRILSLVEAAGGHMEPIAITDQEKEIQRSMMGAK